MTLLLFARAPSGPQLRLVLDYTGLAGKHRLVGPTDVLAGEDLGRDWELESVRDRRWDP